MTALRESLLLNPEVDHWKNMFWTHYKADLYRHVLKLQGELDGPGTAVALDGLLGVEEQAIRFYAKDVQRFWKFTGEMLRCEEGQSVATQIDCILEGCVKSGNIGLNVLLSAKSFKISYLAQHFAA